MKASTLAAPGLTGSLRQGLNPARRGSPAQIKARDAFAAAWGGKHGLIARAAAAGKGE